MNSATVLPLLLSVAGVLLQFLMRQFASVKEYAYHSVAAALGVCVYALMTPGWLEGDWRTVTLNLILWMSTHLPSIWGGTFAASGLAKQMAKTAGAGSVFVPVTDSK